MADGRNTHPRSDGLGHGLRSNGGKGGAHLKSTHPIGIQVPSQKVIGDTVMQVWRVQVPSEKVLGPLGTPKE